MNGLRRLRTGGADEQVDQDRDVGDGEAGGEDRPEGFLEGVGAPDFAAGGLEPFQRLGLLVGEVVGLLEQRPARVL